MVSDSTRVTAVFVVLGLVLWYVATLVTDSTQGQLFVLVAVGVVAPAIVNYRRRQNQAD